MLSDSLLNVIKLELEDILEEDDLKNLRSLIINNIEYLLRQEGFLIEDHRYKISLISGSISSNIIDGYYDGDFCIWNDHQLKPIISGDFITDIRITNKPKIEILNLYIWFVFTS